MVAAGRVGTVAIAVPVMSFCVATAAIERGFVSIGTAGLQCQCHKPGLDDNANEHDLSDRLPPAAVVKQRVG